MTSVLGCITVFDARLSAVVPQSPQPGESFLLLQERRANCLVNVSPDGPEILNVESNANLKRLPLGFVIIHQLAASCVITLSGILGIIQILLVVITAWLLFGTRATFT